ASAVLTYGAVVGPLVAVAGGRVASAAAFGSSRVTPGARTFATSGGSLVWELHLQGPALFALSRVAPLVVAGTAALWARRRFGDAVARPEVVVALLGLAFFSRVLLDQNFIHYYLAPGAVALVLVEVLRGRFRGDAVVWLGLSSVMGAAFPPSVDLRFDLAGLSDYQLLYLVALAAFATAVVVGLVRRSWSLFPAGALTLTSLVYASAYTSFVGPIPRWLVQLALAPTGLWLVTEPLRRRDATRITTSDPADAAAGT
ncbi:MAG: hypothetical protein KGL18_07985, partial [Burkholderiales bacterium]|nr:hypothetical protein [Burkholderiales bacterium]